MTIIYLDKVEISDGLNDGLTMTDLSKVQKHVLDYNNL